MTATNRLEFVRQMVDEIIPTQPDTEQRRCGYVHLYGVSAVCVLLAFRRGLDPELCAAAGMLHDIWNYGPQFSIAVGPNPNHGSLGIPEARRILDAAGFAPAEIKAICTAIERHSDKETIHGELDELLKDADVLQHYLYNPALKAILREDVRGVKILDELGLG
jgi:uncharacterized protein